MPVDKDVLYSVVVPVYNSEKTIVKLVNGVINILEIYGELFEIILVDDCSNDQSWKLIKNIAKDNQNIISIQLMRNFGQGSATLAGLESSSGKFIITMDDDLQHPPEELPKLIESIHADEDIDVVIGTPEEKIHHKVRNYGSSFVNKMNTLFLGKPEDLRFTGFRIIRKNVVDALLLFNIPYPALGPMIVNTTSRVKNIEFKHEKRVHGKSNYSLRKLLKQFLSNFIGYSVLPLHMLAIIGAIGMVVSTFTGLYFLFQYIVVGISVPGWTTLLLILLILMGFTFLSFSIIGEYLLRVNQVSSKISRWNVRQTVSNRNTTEARNDSNNI
jgi:polyisoprenyl-phosphate glycosyltransferase